MWGSPSWGVRRLRAHIVGLPPESAYARRHNDGWRQEHELAAATIDVLHRLEYYYVAAHSDRAPDSPEPFPRPGGHRQAPPQRETVSLTRFTQLLRGDG